MTTSSPQKLEAQNNFAFAAVYLSVPLSLRNKRSTHFYAGVVLHLLAQVSGVEFLQVCGSGCNLWTQFVSLAQLLEVGQALNHLTLNPGPNL